MTKGLLPAFDLFFQRRLIIEKRSKGKRARAESFENGGQDQSKLGGSMSNSCSL